MPKLAKKVQKAAEKAEIPGGGFPLLDAGKYTARLAKVEPRTSNAGNPVWNIQFDELRSLDGEEQPGRQWYNLNMPIDVMPDSYRADDPQDVREKKWKQYQDMTLGRIHGFFEALGYTVDSDTDEMIGDRCVLQISVGTAQRGKRIGEQVNQVENVEPLSDDMIDAEADGDDDDF